MRDLKVRVETPGDQATKDQMEEWRILVENFLSAEWVEEDGDNVKRPKPKKLNRIATYEHFHKYQNVFKCDCFLGVCDVLWGTGLLTAEFF